MEWRRSALLNVVVFFGVAAVILCGSQLWAEQGNSADIRAGKEAYLTWKKAGTATRDQKRLISEYVQGIRSHRHRDNYAIDAQGGPDAYGYRFVNNQNGDTATFSFIELCGDPLATEVVTGDDEAGLVTWSFNFSFYGTTYTSVYASTDGMLSFNNENTDYDNLCPYATEKPLDPQIAVYWDDLYALDVGGCDNDGLGPWVMARDFGTYVVIEWRRLSTFDDDTDRLTFEAILYANGRIKLQYRQFNVHVDTRNSGTIGIDAPGANNGLEYACDAAGNTIPNSANRAVWFFPVPPQANDFSCLSVDAPTRVVPSGSAVVVATFINRGTNANSSPVKYQFNGGAIVSSATGNLAQFGTEQVTFAPLTAPATEGDYPLKVWSDLATDQSRGNDTINAVVHVAACSDYSVTAPYTSPIRNTCGTGDDCDMDIAEEEIYQITIPHSGSWTFSLCNDATDYDSHIYLSNSCCSGLIDENDDDDSCESLASALHCESLSAGTYFLDIEGFFGDCGNYSLSIYECVAPPCDSALAVTIQRVLGQDSVRVNFVPPATGTYKLWRTSNKNNDGNPDNGTDADWAMVGELTTNPPNASFTDAILTPYANYVVTQDCGVGREQLRMRN